jgi:ribosomal protein L37AE/L43A
MPKPEPTPAEKISALKKLKESSCCPFCKNPDIRRRIGDVRTYWRCASCGNDLLDDDLVQLV